MSGFGDSLSISASAMRAQASRIRLVSENVANADTPGYRRKTAPFDLRDGQVELGPVRLDQRQPEMIYDPGHPLADATGHYSGSNVDMIIEIADAREAQRAYDANLKMFDQTRKMQSNLMELLRR